MVCNITVSRISIINNVVKSKEQSTCTAKVSRHTTPDVFAGRNWNLSRMDRTYMPDMNEIRYNPSMKDLNDATIHHLLDSDQNNPRHRVRLSARGLIGCFVYLLCNL